MNFSMGKLIRRLRRNLGLTQDELAEQLSVTSQAVSRWESEAGLPDITMLVPLARALEVTTDTLLGVGSDDEERIIEDVIGDAERINETAEKPIISVYTECFDMLMEALKKYPANYKLMLKCMYFGVCVNELYLGMDDKDIQENSITKIREIINKLAQSITEHCDNTEYVRAAHGYMVKFFCDIGELGVASQHMEKLDRFSDVTRGYAAGEILLHRGRYAQSRAEFEGELVPVFEKMLSLFESVFRTYVSEDNYEQAEAVYNAFINLYDTAFGSVSSPVAYTSRWKMISGAAVMFISEEKRDDALKALEKLYDLSKEFYLFNQGSLRLDTPYTESYVFPRTPQTESRERKDILDVLNSPEFDDLKDNARFIHLCNIADKYI